MGSDKLEALGRNRAPQMSEWVFAPQPLTSSREKTAQLSKTQQPLGKRGGWAEE